MKKIKLFSILAGLFLLNQALFSQRYITTLGLRTAESIGLSLEQKLWKNFTTECMYLPSTRNTYESFTGVLLYHKPILTRNLSLFAGAGFSALQVGKEFRSSPMGIALKAGLGITIWRINVSCDIQPVYYYKNKIYSLESSTGLSLRYVIIKEPKRKKFNFIKKWKRNNN